MRTGLAYSTARILLFVAATGLLYLAGARGIVLLALALVISGLASYILLSKQRDAMSSALARRLANKGDKGERKPRRRWGAEFRTRLEEGARAEDVDDEAAADVDDAEVRQ